MRRLNRSKRSSSSLGITCMTCSVYAVMKYRKVVEDFRDALHKHALHTRIY